jgi:hypothetical protein
VNLGDAGTLSQLYANLTSDSASNAWPNFQTAIQNLPNGIIDDDPFGGLAQPVQMSHLSPQTAELVGRVFAVMIAEVTAGRQPEHIAASVRAALLPAIRGKTPTACAAGSKRLLPPNKSQRATKSA